MIAVATDYLSQCGVFDRVHLINDFVENETLLKTLGEFDLVYSTFSLHHWIDPVKAFMNLSSVLKDGGVLLIYDFHRTWVSWRLPLVKGMLESIHAAYTREEIRSMLIQTDIQKYEIRSNFAFLSILAPKSVKSGLG